MRNYPSNAIVVEFANSDTGEDVFLDPEVLLSVARALNAVGKIILKEYDPNLDCRVFLSAFDQGSVRVGFVFRLMQQAAPYVGPVKDTAELLGRLGTFIFVAGVSLGFITPQEEHSEASVDHEIISKLVTENAEFRKSYDGLVGAAMRAKCDKVTLILPDGSAGALVSTSNRDTRWIGSRGKPFLVKNSEFNGVVKIRSRAIPLQLESNKKPLDLYLGDIDFDGEPVRVVMEWHSKRPIENNEINMGASVSGRLAQIDPSRWYSTDPIPLPLYDVQAFLIVEKQFVGE